MLDRYARRGQWLYRWLRPPVPVVHNPREAMLPATSGPVVLVGAAGGVVPRGVIGLDLFAGAGVSLRASLEALPFAPGVVGAIECDAVLEHVRHADRAVAEMHRVLRPGGYLHVVVPFNHPFHEYPADFRRWTVDGLRELLGAFEIVDVGVRTGPVATMLTFFLELVKVSSPATLARPAYAAAGWIVWPLRYMDLWLYRRPAAHILANSI
jgi:SAM-dependent methyltransferase